jgi:Uma2 family endonuclease
VHRSVPADREIEPVPTQPLLVCIEALSPEDRWARMECRIEDFLEMGVERVWVFDPQDRCVFDCSRTGYHKVTGDLLELPGTPICIRLSELMADLD